MINGAVERDSPQHDYLHKQLKTNSQREVRDSIKNLGGSVSFHMLSRLANDDYKECEGCGSDFYPSNKNQTTCTMQCRDMVRRYTKRDLPMPAYTPKREEFVEPGDDTEEEVSVEELDGYDDL